MSESVVLCGSSGYEKKYYFNPEFANLPSSIQDELKIMCVLFTEEVSCVLTVEFEEDGHLELKVTTNEFDPLYDEISSGLKIKQIITEKQELFQSLELFYKVFVLGMEA